MKRDLAALSMIVLVSACSMWSQSIVAAEGCAHVSVEGFCGKTLVLDVPR